MIVKPISRCMGCDVNQSLSTSETKMLQENGYDFVIRYIPRNPRLMAGNLTAIEIAAIHAANMPIGIVQHCESGLWHPEAELGQTYGEYAAEYLKGIGVPPGMLIWLDLESVATEVKSQDVIDYVTEWAKEITAAEYVAGVYVGWQPGLTNKQLYDLPVKSYWSAYNADNVVPTRGFQIRQKTQVNAHGIEIDPDVAAPDELGDSALFLYSS